MSSYSAGGQARMTRSDCDNLHDAVAAILQQWSLLHPDMTLKVDNSLPETPAILQPGSRLVRLTGYASMATTVQALKDGAAARALGLHRQSLQRKLLKRPPSMQE